jgi:ADP-heptose:LPS heptosyltransferase
MNQLTKTRPKILIVLIAGIGDLVLASRALRAIRSGYPDAEIHLLTSTDAAPLAAHYPDLDRVWSFPIRELRSRGKILIDIMKLVLQLRNIRFHEILNLYQVGSIPGALKMGLLFSSLKSRLKIGHGAKGFGFFLTQSLPANTFTDRHFSDAMLDIALAAGGVPDNRGIEVFWDSSCEMKWESLLGSDGPTGKQLIIGINPGGDRSNRRWAPERYALVADRLIDRFHAKILILGGPGEEVLARQIEGLMKAKAHNLAGKMNLNDLAFLISRMDLLVTNDSAPMHIAAASGTPLVALFGPEDLRLMGPYTTHGRYRILYESVPCRPCSKAVCETAECLDRITTDDVFERCLEILETHKPELFTS